jgi:hypothetical protein
MTDPDEPPITRIFLPASFSVRLAMTAYDYKVGMYIEQEQQVGLINSQLGGGVDMYICNKAYACTCTPGIKLRNTAPK